MSTFPYFYTSAYAQPVRPVQTTGQTGCKKTLRILVRPVQLPVRPVQKNLRGCNSALKCATQQLSNLGVSIHDFPPLCIPADKFDAAGAKIHVWVP